MHVRLLDILLSTYLLHIYLVVRLLSHWLYICSVLIFFGKCFSRVTVLICISTNRVWELKCSMPLLSLALSIFLILEILESCVWRRGVSYCVFTLHFLGDKRGWEHFHVFWKYIHAVLWSSPSRSATFSIVFHLFLTGLMEPFFFLFLICG